jgi:hypothetical protein
MPNSQTLMNCDFASGGRPSYSVQISSRRCRSSKVADRHNPTRSDTIRLTPTLSSAFEDVARNLQFRRPLCSDIGGDDGL